MKQISRVLTTSCLLTVAALSSGVQANNLSSADVSAIHSATFDGPPAPPPVGQFIPTPTGTNVVFANVGTANGGTTATGTGIVEYDGTTARLTAILLPDMDVTINGTAVVNTTGASLTLTTPGTDTEAGIAGFQVDGGVTVVADFSSFPSVTTACTEAIPAICPGVPFLNLDGLRYQIDGTVTAAGGDVLTITLQTSNDSVLVIDVVTSPAIDTDTANVAQANVAAIHSATFDGPPTPDGNFIPAPTGTNVVFTNVGNANGGITSTGTGVLEYDGTTVRLAAVLLPDMDVTINGTAVVNTTGASLTLTSPGTDTEAGTAGFQVEGGVIVVADFSSFPSVVIACTEPSVAICPGVPFLNLDGIRYQLDGTITPEGGDALTITLQTSNDSVLVIDLVTVAPPSNVPFPAFALLGIFASFGIIVYANRKRVA